MSEREWEPIESAPRDGTHVIVYSPGLDQPASAFVCEGYWCEDGACWQSANTHPSDYHDGTLYYVTHWMPLPPPPRTP